MKKSSFYFLAIILVIFFPFIIVSCTKSQQLKDTPSPHSQRLTTKTTLTQGKYSDWEIISTTNATINRVPFHFYLLRFKSNKETKELFLVTNSTKSYFDETKRLTDWENNFNRKYDTDFKFDIIDNEDHKKYTLFMEKQIDLLLSNNPDVYISEQAHLEYRILTNQLHSSFSQWPEEKINKELRDFFKFLNTQDYPLLRTTSLTSYLYIYYPEWDLFIKIPSS